MENIADGGAALIAYRKLQYTDMPEVERLEIKNSLLKYWELDTLAMVFFHHTFNGFRIEPEAPGERIDFIFIKNKIQVVKFSDGGWTVWW